jgi:hypothetical protein
MDYKINRGRVIVLDVSLVIDEPHIKVFLLDLDSRYAELAYTMFDSDGWVGIGLEAKEYTLNIDESEDRETEVLWNAQGWRVIANVYVWSAEVCLYKLPE